jgi:hypothetical protein
MLKTRTKERKNQMPVNPKTLARDIDTELTSAGVPSGPFGIMRKRILLAFAKGIVKSLGALEIEGTIESIMTEAADVSGGKSAHRHAIRTIKLTGLKIK